MINIDTHQDNPPTFKFDSVKDSQGSEYHWLRIILDTSSITIHLRADQVELVKSRMKEAANG